MKAELSFVGFVEAWGPGMEDYQKQEVLGLADPLLWTCSYWRETVIDHLTFRGWVGAKLSVTS